MKPRPFVLCACVAIFLSGCATFYGGKRNLNQELKPQPGEAKRKIRWGFIAADLCTGPGAFYLIPIDFLTKSVYRPVLPDSVRRARILLNKREKRYVSLGTNLFPLLNGSAEVTAEYRISPALGISGSVLHAWNGTFEGLLRNFSANITNRRTTGYATRLGVRAYPVSILSPEVRSVAEFYLGADLMSTSFEQQATTYLYENGQPIRSKLLRVGDRLLGYALTYGSVIRCWKRLDLDTSLQFSVLLSAPQEPYYPNTYIPGFGADLVGGGDRIRLNFGLRYRF